MIKNQKGFITTDFIFAVTLLIGLTALLFTLTFTLSVASVTQYITFAAARNYVVAHLTRGDQEGRAKAKYDELINHKVFKPLFSQGWFRVDKEPGIGDHTRIIAGYDEAAQGWNKFWGVGTRFVAPILDFRIPFFGSTVPEGDGTGKGFNTYLGSYLGREPNADECLDFVDKRWEAIRKLSVPGGAASYDTANSDANAYYSFADDGC